VNIDNGFGGGFAASLINRNVEAARVAGVEGPDASTAHLENGSPP